MYYHEYKNIKVKLLYKRDYLGLRCGHWIQGLIPGWFNLKGTFLS